MSLSWRAIAIASAYTFVIVSAAACKRDREARPVFRDGGMLQPVVATSNPNGGPATVGAPARPWANTEAAPQCERALREMCGIDGCATFESAKNIISARKTPACLVGNILACGSGQSIDYRSSFDSLKATYDARGALIAMELAGDTTPTGCSFGVKPCNVTPAPTATLCASRPIGEHCTGKCPSLTEMLAQYRTNSCAANTTVDFAKCGAYTVLREQSPSASIVRTYDERGLLVSAEAKNAELGGLVWGTVPACEREPAVLVCPRTDPIPTAPPPKKRR